MNRDLETVQLLRAGAEDGLRHLLRDHSPRIHGALRREFFGEFDRNLIEETILTAAHRAWKSIDSYDANRGTLRAWFYVMARRCALRILARERRQRNAVHLADWENVSARDLVTAPSPEQTRFLSQLRRSIDALPPLQRAVVEADLADGHVADAAGLAAELDTTTNSIYVSRSKARKSLRKALESLIEFGDNPGAQMSGSAP